MQPAACFQDAASGFKPCCLVNLSKRTALGFARGSLLQSSKVMAAAGVLTGALNNLRINFLKCLEAVVVGGAGMHSVQSI
jgi:hypothetical protein